MPVKQTKRKAPTPEDIQLELKTKEIIREIKGGNDRAFGELVRMYRNQVASLAYKMVGDYDEAADITQNVFVKTSRNIWRYDEKKKFYTWLYRITVNASIDHMRKHNRHRHEPLENFPDIRDKVRSSPDFSFHRRELRGHIDRAAETLNDKQRSAFLLRDVEGCKVDDVANILDMPEATVRWYLHRARARIRKELTRRCPHLLFMLGVR